MKSRYLSRTAITACLCLASSLCALSDQAGAATIAWSEALFTNTNQVINAGTEVAALNLNGGITITMNGVDFTPGDLGGTVSDTARYDPTSDPITGLTDAQANDLLDNTNFGPGGGTSLIPQNATSGLSGLTMGLEYTIQTIAADRTTNRNYDYGHGPPESAANYTLQDTVVTGAPRIFTGVFTASGPTQDVHIQLDDGTNFNWSFAAWQLRVEADSAAPEPTTFVLLVLGLVGLASRRHRRRQVV